MQTRTIRAATACGIVTLAATAFLLSGSADAARVGILSNNYVNETTADFNARVGGHTFTAVNVSGTVPALSTLTANYDVILVFEDSTFPNATAVGNVAAAFANTGRAVVLGTFYDQDRSDGPPTVDPHGWGGLESIDPSTTDGVGTAYATRSLDASSIGVHPLTAGVTSLFSSKFAGGNELKPGSIVVANWAQKNARGNPDPAIAYRISGQSCVIQVAIAPHYPTIGVANTDFGGDFYLVWRDAFNFGAGHCVNPFADAAIAIPAASPWTLALTALLLTALGLLSRRFVRR